MKKLPKDEFVIETIFMLEYKEYYQIRELRGKKETKEVDISYFNTTSRFIIFRNFLSLNLVRYMRQEVTRELRIQFCQKWLDCHGENFEETTAEKNYENPGERRQSRTRNLNDSKPKLSSKDNIVTIDLTNEQIDNDKDKPTWMKKREKKKKIVRRIVIKSLNDDTVSQNINNISKKKRIAKDYWLNINTKTIHRSKKEVERRRRKANYEIRSEENQCFFYAIRYLSAIFPKTIHLDTFKGKDIPVQLKIANEILLMEERKLLIWKGKFHGSLNMIKNMLDGSYFLLFNFKDKQHVEGLKNKCFSQDIQKEIMDIAQETMLIDLYKLEEVENGNSSV